MCDLKFDFAYDSMSRFDVGCGAMFVAARDLLRAHMCDLVLCDVESCDVRCDAMCIEV